MMKNISKSINESKKTSKIESGVTIDKKLNKMKNINFVSNKIEEVNEIINKLELNF